MQKRERKKEVRQQKREERTKDFKTDSDRYRAERREKE